MAHLSLLPLRYNILSLASASDGPRSSLKLLKYEQDYSLSCRTKSPGLPQQSLLVLRPASLSVVPGPVLACLTVPTHISHISYAPTSPRITSSIHPMLARRRMEQQIEFCCVFCQMEAAP